jgi:phytoene dehydrogenase-like protein
VVERYAPGTRDLIIGTNIRCPEDFPSHNGNIYHVDMLLSQMGPWRPTPRGSPGVSERPGSGSFDRGSVLGG